MQKVFISWSGGKDSSYACYLARKSGMDVRYLLNMMDEKGEWSFVHRFPLEVLKQQSEATGIPLLHSPSTMNTYEDDFTRNIEKMKKDGVEGGVFGDIDLEEHREWVENICKRSGVYAHLPMWGLSQDAVMADFIAQGFKAVIIACNEKYFGEEWLGRQVDKKFFNQLKEMQKTSDVSTCGEAGEYHTLVTDGPIFSKRIKILKTENRYNNGYWFLEIQKSELRDR
jgi:diphthine-ammonia ligase